MANSISIGRLAGEPPLPTRVTQATPQPTKATKATKATLTAAPVSVLRGRVFDVKRFSSHDGPGIRSTVFLTGCPLRCAWCHNPEAFICEEDCPDGMTVRELTVSALVAELERDLPYFDRSGGGITVSGGEPLFQSHFTRALLRACRDRELHTALDTTGCADSAVLLEAASLANVVLYDLKSMDPIVHTHWTGVDNHRILKNLRLLDATHVPVWIRFPLVPGVNDSMPNLRAMSDFLLQTRFRKISILPYHRIAVGKYQRLNLTNRMGDTPEPNLDSIEAVRRHFTNAGFDPHIGR